MTLHGLVGSADLNGTTGEIVAPADAPKVPSAGRAAVRLCESKKIVSLKIENVSLGVPVGTTVSVPVGDADVGPDGAPFQRRDIGTVLHARADGSYVVVLDSIKDEVECPRGAVVLVSTASLSKVDLFNTAEDARNVGENALRDGLEACIAARSVIAKGIDAARRLRPLCEHPVQAAMVAANELDLLRISAGTAFRGGNPQRSLFFCDDAIALCGHRAIKWSELTRIPARNSNGEDGMTAIAEYHSSLSLIIACRVAVLTEHPRLREAGDTPDTMLGALQRARGMAKKAAALVTEFNHLRQEAQLTATFFNRNAELGAAIVARLEELEGAMTTRRTIARAAAAAMMVGAMLTPTCNSKVPSLRGTAGCVRCSAGCYWKAQRNAV